MEKREEFEIPVIAFTPVMLSGGATSNCTIDENNTEAVSGRTQTNVDGPSN